MTGKTIAILWLSSAVVMTIGSLFIFSVGWDKLKDYLDSSTIEGRLQRPMLAGVTLEPRIALFGLSSPENIMVSIPNNGQFSQREIPPGRYRLEISGRGIRKVQHEIEIPKKKAIDLGSFPLEIDSSALLLKEEHPSFRVATVGIGPDESLWAVGFKDNDYKIFVKRANRWNEVFIPQFKGAIQVIAVTLFSDETFLLGSVGNGAVISRDRGISWESLKLPTDVWGVSTAIELPDKPWLLVAMAGQRYVKSNGALLKSSDRGKTWKVIFRSEDEIRSIRRLSSNRLIAGTTSIFRSAAIYYSDDFGESWSASDIKKIPEPLRGITTFIELSNGTVLAGNQDGRSWKGDFLKGGVILNSTDGGLTWNVLLRDEKWKGVNALYETADNKLLAWSGIDALLSQDMGVSWSPVFQTGSGYRDTLISIGQHLYLIGGDRLYKLATPLDEKSLNAWLRSDDSHTRPVISPDATR